ncbi:TetR/AcrR family transcriptional regulator [Nocardia cerradoensis]|nr:TetR/AcrR family transcriptional regulator [Nocardia cerradoensis]
MPQGPRERLIVAAIGLVREHGVEGTALSDLLERSNSARRSIYQHFPGGKNELIDASTRVAGKWMKAWIREVGATMDSSALVRETIRQMTANLIESDYRSGCPIAAAAAASAETPEIRAAASAAFADWAEGMEILLVREGRTAEEAHSLAGFLLSAIEGALLRARAARSTEPMEQVTAQLRRLLTPVSED